MSPTVDVEVRRNRHGSVLAYADRDRAARLLADHRAVLQSLYDLVDRRHGSDGETVARLAVREDSRIVDELDLRDRFRRDLEADRAIALVEDLRYHAGERELVTDGGEDRSGDGAYRIQTSDCCGAPIKRAFYGAMVCGRCRSEVDGAGRVSCTDCENGTLRVSDGIYAECDDCDAVVLRTEAGI